MQGISAEKDFEMKLPDSEIIMDLEIGDAASAISEQRDCHAN